MRYFLEALTLFLLACNSQKDHQSPAGDRSEDQKISNTAFSPRQANSNLYANAASDSIAAVLNEQLKNQFQNNFHVLTVEEANWNKEEWDASIRPRREKDPLYPIVAKGDFNWDGKEDRAALITNDSASRVQISFFLRDEKIVLWEPNVKGARIEKYESPKDRPLIGNVVMLKGDGLLVQLSKTSAYVIHWNGRGFDRAWMGD